MGTLTVSATVPVVQKHMKFCRSLIRNLSLVDPPFDEVVIVASGIRRRNQEKIKKLAHHYSLDIKIISTPLLDLRFNRNLGWLASKGDIVCFLDADDIYSPAYRKAVERIFTTYPADLFIHSFYTQPNTLVLKGEFPTKYTSNQTEPFSLNDYFHQASIYQRAIQEIPNSSINSGLLLGKTKSHFHQGHLSIRREVVSSLSFDLYSTSRNEDGQMLSKALELGFEVYLSEDKLSIYGLNSSALYFSVEKIFSRQKRH